LGQPADGLARCGAGGERATGGEEGFVSTKWWDSSVLSPAERARPRFSLVQSPRALPGGSGWPGLSGRMKSLIRTKTRSRGHGWTVCVHTDEKKGVLVASLGKRVEMLLLSKPQSINIQHSNSLIVWIVPQAPHTAYCGSSSSGEPRLPRPGSRC
jgi:hypothetical protein